MRGGSYGDERYDNGGVEKGWNFCHQGDAVARSNTDMKNVGWI